MQGFENTEMQMRINCEWNGLLEKMYPNSSSFVQQPQPKLCRDLSGRLSCYAWVYSHRNTHCSRINFSGTRDRLFLLSLSTVFGSSLVSFLLFLLSCFPAFLLSDFPAFLLSCFPAFLLFCFPSFLLSCFPAFSIFVIVTRLCKALCPHPGEMVYLAYLMFLLLFMIFPAFLLVCLFAFLLS